MKILELRFKNLNSLKGEWLIDFTDPAFTDNSLFAITGPTGSGKSTILDALCLALYGCTPRIKTLSKSTNEIMTRHTGECYAEAVFETHSGTYRCHWSQHRARKKAGGKLADSRHEISDFPSGAHQLTRKKEVSQAVKERTGMDFDRFTRSILLAQGSFASFLKAEVSERADVLEQITGTGIYSDISRRVHERRRENEEILNTMKAAVSGIELMDEEETAALTEKLSELEETESREKKQADTLARSLSWLEQLKTLKAELLNLKEKRKTLEGDLEESAPERVILENSLLASELEADYVLVCNLRKQIKSDTDRQADIKKILPGLLESIKENKRRLHRAEGELKQTGEAGSRTLEIIKQTRALDLQIQERVRNLTARKQGMKAAEEAIVTNSREQKRLDDSLLNLQRTCEEISSAMEENRSHELLETELAGIKEVINQINRISGQLAEKNRVIRKIGSEMCQADANLHEQNSALIRVKEEYQRIQTAGTELERSLSELLEGGDLKSLKNEKENTQKKLNLLREIASLEDRRARLTEGSPCPLCGSEHHPYALSQTPEKEDTEKELQLLSEKIRYAESLSAKIIENEKQKHNSELMLKDCESRKLQWETKQAEALENSKNAVEEKQLLESEIEGRQNRVSEFIKTLGIRTEYHDYRQLTGLLEQMRSKWQENQKRLETLTGEMQKRESEKQNLLGALMSMQTTLDKDTSVLGSLSEEITELKENRAALFADKDCDREEKRIREALQSCEQEEKTASEALSMAERKEEQARLQCSELEERTENQKSELYEKQKKFSEEAGKRGFCDEKTYLSSRLRPDERQKLSDKLSLLDDRLTRLKARQEDRNQKITEEKQKNLTTDSAETLLIQQEQTALSLKELREEIGALRQKQEADRKARSKLKEKAGEIEKQNRELLSWNNLHALIGSADGQKFQKFAQGLTFETMISHANLQLEKMTDRYILLRDMSLPLELTVVDNYQAGEIRSTKNLSGGESFIVSLALALGLSSMASNKVRVDSLFLDEGFGTLDEQALETALETLSELQQEGKLIGVISHVSALKESIGTRITVTPGAGGCSRISGPGVRVPEIIKTGKSTDKKEQGILFQENTML